MAATAMPRSKNCRRDENTVPAASDMCGKGKRAGQAVTAQAGRRRPQRNEKLNVPR